MRKIENLSDDAVQTTHVTMDDGTIVDITLIYMPAIERWRMDITHPRMTIRGKILCNHPNLLRQFRYIIPFGIACAIPDGTEPTRVDDFTTDRASLYVMTAADVEYIEAEVFENAGNA